MIREATVEDAAWACLIVATSATVTVLSLLLAWVVPATIFVGNPNPMVLVMVWVVIGALVLVAGCSAWGVAGFLKLGNVPLDDRLKRNPKAVIRHLAWTMALVLAVVIWLTGGPLKSWFTPLLLVFVPLMIQLQEREKGVLWRMFGCVIAVYGMTLGLALWGPANSNVTTSGQAYLWSTLAFVLLTVVLPTFLQIFGLRGEAQGTKAKPDSPLAG